MQKCFVLFLALVLSSATIAQEPITIKVSEANSSLPIENCLVILYPDQDSLYTDVAGELTISRDFESASFQTGRHQEKVATKQKLQFFPNVWLEPIPLVVNLESASCQVTTIKMKRISYPLASYALNSGDLNRDDQSSLQFALNDIPGVKFESRGYGGSRRVNMRGSLLRSPFAVRNVQIYLDQVPLTGPDGQGWLEVLDPSDIGQLLVMKGPSAHAFGSGTGGALIANSPRLMGEFTPTQISTSQTVGSFNYYRSHTHVSVGSEDISLRLSHNFQETKGYRLQEYNRKQQTSLRLRYAASNQLDYFLMAMQYNGRWGLPGGLTLEQAHEDPTQASPYSIDNNAHVDRMRFIGAITQRWTGRKVANYTTIFANTTDKINPFGTSPFFNGYKDETATGGGARTFTRWNAFENQQIDLDVENTVQFHRDENDLIETDNDFGGPGTLRYTNNTLSQEALANVTAKLIWREKLNLEAGATFQWRSIESINLIPDSTSNDRSDIQRNFDHLSYSAGLSYDLHESTSLFINVSNTYSPPSNFELLDPENGALSTTLEAEVADQIEIGFNSEWVKGLRLQASAYRMQLTNSVRPVEDDLGITRFINNGSSRLDGVEGRLTYIRAYNREAFLRSLVVSVSGALQDYVQNGIGNELEQFAMPGIPLATASAGLQVVTKPGVFLDAQAQWTDSTPLNNSNSTWMASYRVVNVRVGWKTELKDVYLIEVFGGSQNLLDELYTSFPLFNAFGGRFYNPMPGRSFYGGVRLTRVF